MNLFKIWALLLFIFYLLKKNKIGSKVRVHSDLLLLPTLPKLTNKTLSIVLQMEMSKNLIFWWQHTWNDTHSYQQEIKTGCHKSKCQVLTSGPFSIYQAGWFLFIYFFFTVILNSRMHFLCYQIGYLERKHISNQTKKQSSFAGCYAFIKFMLIKNVMVYENYKFKAISLVFFHWCAL